jgi:hypothetical protein
MVTPPDLDGRTWAYMVERHLYRDDFLVYSRRYGNPAFRYSVAWWIYEPESGGTVLRCVNDFELTSGSTAAEEHMQVVIASATKSAIAGMAAKVESVLAEAAPHEGASRL